jgi:serine/threonine protein kinase
MIGKQILHYNITEELGRGGMGVVYKAEDTKLERTVALKFLPPELTRDAEAKDRFFHEARAASSLDHPNICTIYEINEVDGHCFIAMAYVEGRTLKERMREGPSGITEAGDIARQIAEGLGEAHDKGIVHRDIKPGNIMITGKDQVKIMDFGLAKSAGSAKLTKTGTTVGTVHYMSPEQARGTDVDHRTDIWSLGVMLYEMLAGKLPFKGDYEQAVIFSIINDEVEPIGAVRTDIPTGLERVINRALDKNRDSRYQRAEELLEDIRKIGGPPQAPSAASHEKKGGRIAAVYTMLISSIIIIIVLLYMVVFRKAERHPAPVSRQVTFEGEVYAGALSPDGNYAAYVTGGFAQSSKLWIKDLGSGSAVNIHSDLMVFGLRWSPDGSRLKFSAIHAPEKGGVYIIPRLGGAARKILNHPWYYATWSPNGSRMAYYAVDDKKIQLLDIDSGETDTLSLEDIPGTPSSLDWAPVDEYLLIQIEREEHQSITAVKTDGTEIRALKTIPYGSTRFTIGSRWSHDGRSVYYLRGEMRGRFVFDLMKFPVNLESRETDVEPSLVLSGLQISNEGLLGSSYTISRDGKRLMYIQEIKHSNLFLIRVEKAGRNPVLEETQITSGTSWKSSPSISPDGNRVAFAIGEGDASNLFTLSLQGNESAPRQLTFFDSWNDCPAWSPDGNKICFHSHEGGMIQLWRINSEGGTPEPLERAQKSSFYTPPSWAPGYKIIYRTQDMKNFNVLDPETGEQHAFIEDPPNGYMFDPCWSPDGKQVAFFWNRSTESGQIMRTWVLDTGDGSLRVLCDRVAGPIQWSSDGKYIYVVSIDTEHGAQAGSIFRVPSSGGDLEFYLHLPVTRSTGRDNLSMTPDGRTMVLRKIESEMDAWLVENFDPDNN